MTSWGVFWFSENEVHVAPCDDDGLPLDNHRPSLDCPCRPRLIRTGPLDQPVISHREPSHPGSADQLDA